MAYPQTPPDVPASAKRMPCAPSAAARVTAAGFEWLDAGTSGGVWGLENGYCLMVGGDDEAISLIDPILKTIAPGPGEIERTPGRTGDLAAEEQGYLHCGPSGAGHFVKMVHNGIEYGIMAAFAEGLNILHNADAGIKTGEHSAEVAPLESPEYYQFDIDTAKVAELWRRGSVISSWLLDLTAAALQSNPTLDGLAGRVSDSGEGRWTVKAAIDVGVPVPVLAASLFERFAADQIGVLLADPPPWLLEERRRYTAVVAEKERVRAQHGD